jgi:ubiquinone/menaquinone biosynthesis C-methylase UbiE
MGCSDEIRKGATGFKGIELTNMAASQKRDFTPAAPLLWAYDTLAAFTRESRWRAALLQQLNPRESDVIVDVGCGTASFLILLGSQVKRARLIGIDPDSDILKRARSKLTGAAISVELHRGYLREVGTILSGVGVNKIVSSLVFHQVPLAEKRAGLKAIFSALTCDGELHIADYGLQRTRLMRSLFRIVQYIDGFEDTQPNADGILPALMKDAGFASIEETAVIPTVTGSISLYRAVRLEH